MRRRQFVRCKKIIIIIIKKERIWMDFGNSFRSLDSSPNSRTLANPLSKRFARGRRSTPFLSCSWRFNGMSRLPSSSARCSFPFFLFFSFLFLLKTSTTFPSSFSAGRCRKAPGSPVPFTSNEDRNNPNAPLKSASKPPF